jgi:hypothetical protein
MPFCISGSDSFWEPGNYKKTTRWVYQDSYPGHPFIRDFSLSSSFTNSCIYRVISDSFFFFCVGTVLVVISPCVFFFLCGCENFFFFNSLFVFFIVVILQNCDFLTSVLFTACFVYCCRRIEDGERLCKDLMALGKQGYPPYHTIYQIRYRTVWRIRDVYPGSCFLPIPDPGSRIPDPKTATKERGEKKIFVIPFYVATNFTKLNIILVL